MIEYVQAIKRGFRDQHNFIPSGGTEIDPIFTSIPDGEYAIKIDGRIDYVKVDNGVLSFGNFSSNAGVSK